MTASHFREATRVYELTASFPREERYGLSSQLQRAAVSVPSNVAARVPPKDYARFISMASGSNAELQTQLLLSGELDLGDGAIRAGALEQCDRVGQMLLRLHQALMRRLESESRVPSPESRI